jgi:hypothetical protein
MGNEQATPQSRQQVPIKPSEKDPYTLSSISKNQEVLTQQSPSTSIERKNVNEIDGIVQVVTMDQVRDDKEPVTPAHDDEIIETLHNLPRASPLIRKTVDSNFTWKDYVIPRVIGKTSTNTGANAQNLDYIDSRPLIDICAEFQTFALREARSIHIRQEDMINKIRNVHVQSQNVNQQMSKKSDGLKKLATALRDVERINRNVEASRQSVATILKQLQELEELLPHHVKAQIKTPLFTNTNVITPPIMIRTNKT